MTFPSPPPRPFLSVTRSQSLTAVKANLTALRSPKTMDPARLDDSLPLVDDAIQKRSQMAKALLLRTY